MSRTHRIIGGAVLSAVVLSAPADAKTQLPPPPKPVTAEPADVEAIKNELVAAAKAGDMARVRALADRLAASPAGQLTTLSDSIDRVMPEVRANGFAIVSRKYGPWYGYGWGWPATGYQVSPNLWVAGPDNVGWRRTLESLKRARVQLLDKPEALAAVDRQIADYERRLVQGVWVDPYYHHNYPYNRRAVAQIGPIPPIPSAVRVTPDWPASRVVERGRLGIQPERIPSVVLAHLELPPGQGVMVAQVMPGSPAAAIGLMTNDIVLGIGGTAIPDEPDAVGGVVQGLKGGEPLDVSILRKGKPMTIKGLILPAPAGLKEATKEK